MSQYYGNISATGNARQQVGNSYSTTTNYNNWPSREHGSSGSQWQPSQAASSSQQGQGSKKRLRKEDYTVGWICALPVPEWLASRLLLDEEHEDISLGVTARHQYVYGSMNGHNVVMGCLPQTQTGKASAASTASEMKTHFPSLRFGVLVGVGGGAPSPEHDVRLGDVVVSQPDRDKNHGGVVQYDYGRAIQDGKFELTGMLSPPTEILLAGLGKLRATPAKNSKFGHYLQSYEEWADEDDCANFSVPPKTDRLFRPDYVHRGNQKNCGDCQQEGEIDRAPRKTTKPRVHYGTIASGDMLMRDAIKRDQLRKDYDEEILCFEMEAAGCMNAFPCMVIRGICDYCDTHKNKASQPYAAAAAAAWAKEFLRNIAPADVRNEETVGRPPYHSLWAQHHGYNPTPQPERHFLQPPAIPTSPRIHTVNPKQPDDTDLPEIDYAGMAELEYNVDRLMKAPILDAPKDEQRSP